MLTKDLLKIKLHKGHAYPQFIAIEDPDARELGRRLLKSMSEANSKPYASLEEELRVTVDLETHPYGLGFVKLILDRAEFSDKVDDSAERRWNLINTAQALRQERYFEKVAEFQEEFAALHQNTFRSLAHQIYGDLPEFRPLTSFEVWSEDDLIHRYNCALVQGLLLMAPRLRVDLSFANALERRTLFRAIKFHRLVVGDIVAQEGRVSFNIEGPLSILVNTQVYGMRLANFFPHLLRVQEWQIEAAIKFKGKETRFILSEKNQLRSHYREGGGYSPEEDFQEFISAFNVSNATWQAEWCEELMRLGGQQFCFPDITFTHTSSRHKIHLELFHRWHRGELEKRLEVLQKNGNSQLILGICHSLVKKESLPLGDPCGSAIDEFSFVFRSVPTPKAVNTLLDQVYATEDKKV